MRYIAATFILFQMLFLLTALSLTVTARADVANKSNHSIYVQDEEWGRVHMLLPGEVWRGEQDAVALPFERRNAIYKTANGLSIIVYDGARIDADATSTIGSAGQLLLGGWKDRPWIEGKHGYQFRRLFNLSVDHR